MRDHACFVFLGMAVCLAGCMMGPRYETPAAPVDANDRYAWLPPGWSDANDPNAAHLWWTRLGDPTLEPLVQDVLAHNLDLRRATANLDRAQAVLRQAAGLRWPQVDYALNASRSRAGFDASFLPGADFVSFYTTSFSHGVNVAYVLDLFGRLRRNHRAALRDLQALEAERRALAHSLVALAVDLRVQIATAGKLVAISEARVASWEESVTVIERRYEGGLGSPVDLYLAKERLAEARAQVSTSREALMIAQNALDVLRGRPPQGELADKRNPADLPPLSPAPVGVPADLIRRRPDVCAAERRVAAAVERVGEATAQRYPDLTINLGLGANSNEFEKLLDWKYRTLQAAGQLSAPILAGGRLKAQVRAARAQAEMAVADYVDAVLKAVQEVEDALVRGQTATEQLTHTLDQLRQAEKAERLSTDRYTRGVDPILVVLEAERRRRGAEYQIAVTEGALWRNRVSLYLALGGDWGLSGS